MKIINSTVVIGLGLLLITGCGKKEQKTAAEKKVAVEVESVQRGDITIGKIFTGTLEGARQSKIYAVIPERVMDLPVSEGSFVKSGDPIIVLDKGGTSSKYHQAQAMLVNARDNYNKMKNLYDQKAISEMAYINAKTSYDVAEADFQAAKAAVELSVPISGVVTDISVNIGDQAPLGTPIATVANIDKMRLTVYVGGSEVAKLKIGRKARVYIDTQNPIDAKIIEIASSADPETRLFRVELEMDNSARKLKPGMFAKAEIMVDDLKDIVYANNNAIFIEDGIPKVYYVQNDTAYIKTIEVGPNDGVNTQVLNGLEPGQTVVTVGKSNLRDGVPVIITNGKDSADVSS